MSDTVVKVGTLKQKLPIIPEQGILTPLQKGTKVFFHSYGSVQKPSIDGNVFVSTNPTVLLPVFEIPDTHVAWIE